MPGLGWPLWLQQVKAAFQSASTACCPAEGMAIGVQPLSSGSVSGDSLMGKRQSRTTCPSGLTASLKSQPQPQPQLYTSQPAASMSLTRERLQAAQTLAGPLALTRP